MSDTQFCLLLTMHAGPLSRSDGSLPWGVEKGLMARPHPHMPVQCKGESGPRRLKDHEVLVGCQAKAARGYLEYQDPRLGLAERDTGRPGGPG